MALALCLLLDLTSDRLVRELWAQLEAAGIPTLLSHTHSRHVPHLSYAVLLAWKESAVRAAVAGLPDGGPVEIAVQGSVVFPRRRVALAGATSPDLAARHERVVEAVRATGATLHRHYEPGHWTPHVSLSTGVAGAALATVVDAASDRLPLTLRFDRAALIDTSDGSTWPLPGVL
ncbi:2'-5' RNA ligase family protein [Terrabacter aeriphilus]|uniref:2'-5' RNA ligase family protein n=1 Tax=Terrabacter aeriphilus TaxID=515662 RepID=A0ABP9J4Q4_9MICO